MQLTTTPRPIPGVLFGITHQPDMSPIVREPKILRVGIGLPRGPAINFWIAPDKKWCCRIGKLENKKLKFEPFQFEDRAAAEAYYDEALAKNLIPPCNYPRKVGYFNFTRQRILADGSTVMEPAWDAIEAHGPAPTEIDIVFLSDDPLDGGYQMWSKTELRCHGDGIHAERILALAGQPWQGYQPPADEKDLAEAARRDGQRYFPIVNGCWTFGCPYTKEYVADGRPQPSPCKPGGDLKFQLLKSIRVGGTAYFHTTGIRSIQNLFSGLLQIKTLTGGRLAGVPLKLVVKPYRTNHNGQAATQYGVAIEFRADTIEALRQNLIEQALNFRAIALGTGSGVRALPAGPPAMIAAPAAEEPDGMALDGDEDEPAQAAAMAAEFYGDDAGGDGAESAPAEPPAQAPAAAQVQGKTEQRTEALKDRIRSSRTRAAAALAPAPAASNQRPDPVYEVWQWTPGGWALTPDKPHTHEDSAKLAAQARANSTGIEHQVIRAMGDQRTGICKCQPPAKATAPAPAKDTAPATNATAAAPAQGKTEDFF